MRSCALCRFCEFRKEGKRAYLYCSVRNKRIKDVWEALNCSFYAGTQPKLTQVKLIDFLR